MVFGGRDSNHKLLNDLWGLKENNNETYEWINFSLLISMNCPFSRYMHSSVIIGPYLLIIGGKTGITNDGNGIQIYDSDTSQWTLLMGDKRFRHSTFIINSKIFIFGGFEKDKSESPTNSMLSIDIQQFHEIALSINNKEPTINEKLKLDDITKEESIELKANSDNSQEINSQKIENKQNLNSFSS